MSPSSQQNIDQKNPCPDSELLAAFSENQVDRFVSGAIAAHLLQCADCAELHHRLLDLAKADPQGDSPEWRSAEKRLDNWMSTYLRTHPSRMESAAQTEQPVSLATTRTGWKLSSWKMRWALGAVATLAVVIAVFFLSRTFASRARLSEVARQPATPSSAPDPSASSPEKREPAVENSAQIAVAQPEEGAPAKVSDSVPKPRSHAASHLSSAAQAAVVRKEPLDSPSDALNSPAMPSKTSETESAGYTNPVAEPSASSSAATPVNNDSSSGVTGSQTAPASNSSVHASRGFLPVAKSITAPAASLPSVISLEYSTSMWVQLNSDNAPEDGTFRFRGTLLKPVELPASVPFDTKTRLDGLGSVNDGRISLVIQEFFFRGARYKLKSGSGMARVEPFNGGRTLEMWLDEDSVYERVPRRSATAGPRRSSVASREHKASTTSRPAQPPPASPK
jgi:hypothetical protein